MVAKKLKTLGIDEETHILLKKIQSNTYENRNINYDLKEIIHLLVTDNFEKNEQLKAGNGLSKQKIEQLKIENDSLKQENEDLKIENSSLKIEIEQLKIENELLKGKEKKGLREGLKGLIFPK